MAEAAPEGDRAAGAVAVAYVHQDNVGFAWHHSMVELLGYDMFAEARILRGGWIAVAGGTDGLAEARNMAARIFLDERTAEWLFWIDTDMGFSPDIVERLLEVADPVDRPMVGALAFSYRREATDELGGWRCTPTPTLFDWLHLDDGSMGFAVRFDYQPGALTRVGGTGSAAVLIHRTVLERIRAQYGDHWYDRAVNPTAGHLVSEDLSLCLRAGALEIPIHVHTGVKTTHQKTVWVAEDDYFASVALSQLVPKVPPATEPVAVLVPVLGRPQNAKPFMQSIGDAGALDLVNVYAIADAEDQDTIREWLDAGAHVIKRVGDSPGTFAEKVNDGYRATSEPWLFLVGDDVRFHPGWLDHAQHASRDGAHVIGTNDLHNPRVIAGEHGTHLLIRRVYVDERGASWDGPKVVCHEGYGHWWVDQEIVDVAHQRGVWVSAKHSKVEHLHPLWGLAEDDDTYRLGRSRIEADKDTYEARYQANGGDRRA